MGLLSSLFREISKPKRPLVRRDGPQIGPIGLFDGGLFRIGDYFFDQDTELVDIRIGVSGVAGDEIRIDKLAGPGEILTVQTIQGESKLFHVRFEEGVGWYYLA